MWKRICWLVYCKHWPDVFWNINHCRMQTRTGMGTCFTIYTEHIMIEFTTLRIVIFAMGTFTFQYGMVRVNLIDISFILVYPSCQRLYNWIGTSPCTKCLGVWGERVRAVGLATCCNYFSKKKYIPLMINDSPLL